MSKHRLLFAKTGRAIYISHLDLMRTFQRAFLRAGLHLRHSEGFNPHPIMAFALPLSVGTTSVCELLDFDLLSEPMPEVVVSRLNAALPEGVSVLQAYDSSRKFAEIKWVCVSARLEYDKGLPKDVMARLRAFFAREEVIVPKKTKKGMTDFNITPCIGAFDIRSQSDCELIFEARLSAQNPTLNPALLIQALEIHESELAPDFAAFTRLELLDVELQTFR
jgi:radical SAM-linked protein